MGGQTKLMTYACGLSSSGRDVNTCTCIHNNMVVERNVTGSPALYELGIYKHKVIFHFHLVQLDSNVYINVLSAI